MEHPVLEKAKKNREELLKELQKLDSFIETYEHVASLINPSLVPAENRKQESCLNLEQSFSHHKVLSKEESLDWAVKILEQKEPIGIIAIFVDEFEREGYTISKALLSQYMSRDSRFNYDKPTGGWRLVKNQAGSQTENVNSYDDYDDV